MSLSNVRTVTATEANRSPGSVFSAAEKGERVLVLKNNTVQAVAIGLSDYSKLEGMDRGAPVVHTEFATMASSMLPPSEQHHEDTWTLEEALMEGDASTYDPDPLWAAGVTAIDIAPGYLPLGCEDEEGSDPRGVLTLNLADIIRQGAGPTGLVVGASGTGRSTLMRNLAVSLATLNSPQKVQLMLLGEPAASTFSGMDRLPHTLLCENTFGENPRRPLELLVEEMERRKELLEEQGAGSIHQYNEGCSEGSGREPLPYIVVLGDSKKVTASLKDLFAFVTEHSFQFGFHLVAAIPVQPGLSQTGVLATLAQSGFVIALRVHSEDQSKSLLRVPDAAHLPVGRGDAVIQFSSPNGEIVRAKFSSFGAARRSGYWESIVSALRPRDGENAVPMWNTLDARERERPDHLDGSWAWVDDLSAVVRGASLDFGMQSTRLMTLTELRSYTQRASALKFSPLLSAQTPTVSFCHDPGRVSDTFPAIRSWTRALARSSNPSQRLVVWLSPMGTHPWDNRDLPDNVVILNSENRAKDFADALYQHTVSFPGKAGIPESPEITVITEERWTGVPEVRHLLRDVMHTVNSRSKDLGVRFILLAEVGISGAPSLDFSSRAVSKSPKLGSRGQKTSGSFFVPGSPWEHIPWTDGDDYSHTRKAGSDGDAVLEEFIRRSTPQ